jgi:hypothetical protein
VSRELAPSRLASRELTTLIAGLIDKAGVIQGNNKGLNRLGLVSIG